MKTNKYWVYNIMYLPREVEDYRNKILANPPKIPARIKDNWWNRIVPANLYSLGEEGAYIYITKYGGKFGEKTLIHYALQAGVEKQSDMARGFWKRAYLKRSSELLSVDMIKVEQPAESKNAKLTTSFQKLWFTLVREQRKYSCYSIFLVLPADKEATRYLTEYRDDLKIISSSSTLVMMLGSDQHLHVEVDGESLSVETKADYARITHSFGIDFTMFPCVVVFKGMNSSEGIPIVLKGMKAEEIHEKMRMIYSIIQNAAREKRSPLEALQSHQNDERLRHAGKAVIGTVRNFIGFTYKIIIEKMVDIYSPKLNNQ